MCLPERLQLWRTLKEIVLTHHLFYFFPIKFTLSVQVIDFIMRFLFVFIIVDLELLLGEVFLKVLLVIFFFWLVGV